MIGFLRLFLLLTLLTGCGSVGMIASPATTFQMTDQLKLKTISPDILNKITAAGKSLGYSVSLINRQSGNITLHKSTNMLATVAVGTMSDGQLALPVDNSTPALNINLTVIGNFGASSEEAADKIMREFEDELTKQLQA
jgi:hypothetical protein